MDDDTVVLACKQCHQALIQVSSFLAVCPNCEIIYALRDGRCYGVSMADINAHIEHALNPPRVIFRFKPGAKSRLRDELGIQAYSPVAVHDLSAMLSALEEDQ